MFSCEFCKISKNTFSTEHLGTTASWQSGHHNYRFSERYLSKHFAPQYLGQPSLSEVAIPKK